MLKKILKKLSRKHPWIGYRLVSAVHPFLFWQERKCFAGRDPEGGNSRPSVILMTHNRCASVMIHQRLLDLLKPEGYLHRDFQGLVQLDEEDAIDRFRFNPDTNQGRFKPLGRYYGPFRYFVRVPEVERYRLLVVLRDPRDVLVSRYFSEKYSHFRFDKRFAEHCERVESMTLEEFVLKFAEEVFAHYQNYIDDWDKFGKLLFCKYEDVIGDFEGFLTKFSKFAGLEARAGEIRKVAEKENFEVQKEDKYSHKRSVKSGGFREKLDDETIAALNVTFESTLDFFGWEK